MDRAGTRTPRRASGYTADEYLGLVDEGVLGEDDHTELLEGVIVAGEPQNPPHASGVTRVQRTLERAVGDRAIVRVQLDYVAGRRSVPEPDIAIVPPDPDWYATAHPSQAYALFEVADSSLSQDRLTKAPIYAKNGVPQYVLVNLREDCVENHTAPSAPRRRYLERTLLRRGERLALVAFPDVTLAVDDLLPPRRSRIRRG
jgi:Uma2 family endonuclease